MYKMTLLAALLSFGSVALANEADLRQKLIVERGMQQVDDGFYVKQLGDSENWVATNANGAQRIVEKLAQSRALNQKRADAGSLGAQRTVSEIDGLIAALQSEASLDKRRFNCPAGALVEATATAFNGTSASAIARILLDFGPTWTLNTAKAYNEFESAQQIREVATAMASVNDGTGQSCYAHGYASVRCYGTGLFIDVASSQNTAPHCTGATGEK